MQDITETIFNVGYSIWNTLIGIAMTLFTTSPTTANSTIYTTAKTLYNALMSISLPIAITFFLIAIIKDVIATPPEQQARKFIQSTLKFAVLVGILANLWLFMGYIMQIADGITDTMNITGNYELSMSADLQSAIDEVYNQPSTKKLEITRLGESFNEVMEEKGTHLAQKAILFLGAAGTFIMIIAAGLSIINCAFQRIIKPLVLLPFSTITVAMASGSHEAERIATSYLKTFFGLCLAGAFMVVAVNFGAAIVNGGLIAFNMATTDLWEKVMYIVVQNAITPTVIAGLVKSADSTIARFF